LALCYLSTESKDSFSAVETVVFILPPYGVVRNVWRLKLRKLLLWSNGDYYCTVAKMCMLGIGDTQSETAIW